MKKLILAFTALFIIPHMAISQRNYLIKEYNRLGFSLSQPNITAWRNKQKEKFTTAVKALPDSVKKQILAKADDAIAYNWPAIPASLYLDYKLTGNRTRYEQKINERREMLTRLAIGQLINGGKKYLPQLVNGLWVSLEESTWVLPAHLTLQNANINLPDPSENVIDLNCGETSAAMATILLTLGDDLNTYSPMVKARIQAELVKRTFKPYLQRIDFWWMGFTGKPTNNWNIWINTNVLQAALMAEDDPESLNQIFKKVLSSADIFLNNYGDDGGCDEGPSYWSEAGGKLSRLLQLCDDVSGNKLNWSTNRLMQNIAAYPYKTQIKDSYFVNFADAGSRTVPNPESVFRYGEYFHNDTLKQFAASLLKLQKNAIGTRSVQEFLWVADIFSRITGTTPIAPMPAVSWLPQLQVLTARSQAENANGLFVALQGGHNGESHNHNDIGNFIVYKNGEPIIVDVGVGTYTATTFGPDRYKLWNMQSQWHNCPTINGVMQHQGSEYKANTVTMRQGRDNIFLSMDLAAAYFEEAAVKQWERSFDFKPKQAELHIKEKYRLTAWKDTTRINFILHGSAKEQKPGELVFYDINGGKALTLLYNPKLLTISSEEYEITDGRIQASWGKKITRVSAAVKSKSLTGQLEFILK